MNESKPRTEGKAMKTEREFALKAVVAEMKHQATRAVELAETLSRYANELEKDAGGTEASDRFNWAINDIENYIRNINFANLARKMANLKSAE